MNNELLNVLTGMKLVLLVGVFFYYFARLLWTVDFFCERLNDRINKRNILQRINELQFKSIYPNEDTIFAFDKFMALCCQIATRKQAQSSVNAF